MTCKHCENWGETIEEAERLFHPEVGYVPCPECKRWTYPNLGVNCPAGMACAIGTTNAIEKARQMGRSEEVWYHIMDGQARLSKMPKLDKFDKREILENARRQRESKADFGNGPGVGHPGGELPSIVATPVRKLPRSRVRQD